MKLSAKHAAALGLTKATKYRNRRTVVDGLTFDSAKESKRWSQLLLLEMAGKIRDLERQVRFDLKVNGLLVCFFVADFVYRENGARVVEDVKGVRTPVYKLKKRLMKAVLGIDIRET